MPFGLWTRVGPMRQVLHVGSDPLMRRGRSGHHASAPVEQSTRPVFAPAGHNTLHTAGGGDVAFCWHYYSNMFKVLTNCMGKISYDDKL